MLITEEALFHEELMTSDYVMLSWNSDSGMALPLGSYIIYNGEKYSLLEEYNPERTDEYEYRFSPQFHSRIMGWQKQPVPLYTYGEDGITVTGREFDWEFTGSPTDAMYMVQQAIKNETGETWSVQLADSLPATISVSSQSDSIFSLLSQIADACKTEWWVDKSTNTLFLSFCQHGSPVSLSVGVNIKAPSVTSGNKEYFTRFYAFGSTRNITQDNEGGQATNHIVNKRLTLDPAKYPGGYKDVKGHFDNGVFVSDLKPGEIFSTTVYLDDIYPKSKLTISDVRARLKYRLDSGTGDKVQVGTDDDGSPIYEQYAIWYFKIANFSFDLNSIIEGENLSVSFETGQLAGRDFELSYHEKAETVKDGADVTEFEVEAGDYEIILDETSGITIPGLAYIIPQDGDQIVLYNIKMPNEYVASAREELETAIDKEISTRTSDNNSYEFDSDPVSFNDDSMDVMVGQSVNFSNIGTLLQTRVLMVEKHLDYPCQQRIRVGNERIKGNTQQLKEDVTNASQNIDLLKAFNNLSQSLTNAYANAQREMIEGFASIKNMWRFDPDDPSTIYSEFNAYVKGAFSALGKSTETGGGGSFDLLQDWAQYDAGTAKSTALSAYLGYELYQKLQSGAVLSLKSEGTGNVVTGISKNGTVLTVTKGSIDLSPYATKGELDDRIDELVNGAPAAFDTLKEIADVLQGNVDSIGDIITTLGTKADKAVKITAGAGLTGGGDLSANRTLGLAAVGTAGTYTKVTTDAYGRVTAGTTLSAADIPTLAISKISGLQAALDSKLNAADFAQYFAEQMAQWFVRDTGNKALRPADYGGEAYGLYSNAFVSALGVSQGSASGGGSVDILQDWAEYTDEKATWALSAYLGYGLYQDVQSLKGGAALTVEKTGGGNVVTGISKSGTKLTVAKGITALTSVSLATISDLNSSWDALLKAAPAVFVTRWPSISEVTGKQNLVLKLNGGTTEGTSQFTYNGTSAKSVNITTANIGADAKFVTALGTSGNYLKWTKNGTTNNITVPYATNADMLDGTHKSGLLTALTSSASTNLSLTVGGTAKSVADLYATYSERLLNARTLWGQSFDGTANVSGNMSEVGSINFAENGAISIDAYGNIILNNNSASWSISKDSNYAICVRNSSLNVGIGTNNPLYKLHVVGTGYFSGQLTAQSFKLGSGTISWDSDNNCFRFSHGLYSDEFVSALGLSGTTGGGGGDYNRLDDWGDYDTSKATWALSAKLGYELYEDVTSLKNGSALNFTTTGSGNVVSAITKSGTTVTVNKGITALTSHQPIYALTIQGNGTTIGTFNPKSAAATINITPANIGAPTKTGGGASGTWGISISGNAATASKWQTARTLTLTGAVTGSASIDGSGNVSLATTYSTGNISALDSRYVNVSGDTMTGTLTLPASGMFTNSHFRFGNDKGRMGADSSGNLGIYGAGYVVIRPSSATEASSYGLTITSSSLEYNGGKVWHAGNDGSGSGLDADTLDGRHYTSFPLRIGGYLYASSGNPSVKLLTFTRGGDKGWLRISISDCNNGGSGITALYVVKWPYSSSSDASTYPVSISCLYSTVVNVSDRLTVVRTSGATFDLYYTPNSYGSEVGCVLEGYGGTCTINNYDNSTAPTPTPTYTSSQGALFTNISGSLSGNASTATKLQTARQINGTNFDGSANITTAKWGTARTIYIRDASQAHTGTAVSVDGSANEYLLLPSTIAAALDGNATSATKLQTARTLWGQSFNGTANVSGDMTGVGAISMSGLLTANGGILVPSSKTLKIGSGTISWDTANNMFHFSHGLYSDGAVSALGVGSASGGGGGGSVDILQDWAQYDAGTAKSTALSAYLGYEMRQELQSTVGNIGNTPDYVCTLDLSDIDLDFRRLQQAVLGTRPMFYIVTDNSVGNYVVGTMCMFSDNSYHVLTQVLTTHFLVQDGVFSAHVDSKVYTYYRSYNFGAPGLEGPTRQWTEWREAYGLTGEGSFMGVATPSTAAPSLAYGEEAYYVAATAGTYANLGGLTVASGEVALIRAAYSPGDPSTSFSKTTLSKAGGAVTIASITDLHSSWDSVLKAQKPSWLTSVSIATISDLNSGWDALLKAAPAAATSSKMGFMSASDKDVVNRLTTLLHDHAIMYSSPELTGYWGNASYGEIYIPVFGYYDGAWNESTTTIRLPRVSTSNIGLMTADDKKRLDALIDAITGTGKGFVNGVLSIDKTATSISLNYDLFRYTGSDFENGGYGIALPSATTSLAGLMSAADKAKLDSISSGGLESVSIADITDLHSSWDALLKAAPSSHITRWPTFSEVSSKPTTLSGYGITDGVNAVSVGGSGNAVTAASISGHTLTLTKGSTFLLSSAYTAADVLSKLKTVDGSGSGLDADTLDGVHESSLVRMTGRNTIYTSDQAPYAYIHLFRVANSSKYSTLRIDVDVKTRYHAAILHIDIQTNQYPYGDGGSSITIHKQTCNGRSGRFYYKRTVQSSGYNYYDIYYQCGTWNGGSYGIISEGSNGTLVYEPKGTNIAALPDGCTELSETSYPGNASTATKLQTARQINGTNFDGSTNITTAKWGTARTIKIGNTGKSVNGSANVTWTLAEIGSASISEAVGASDAVPEGMTITRAASSFGLTLKTIAGGDLDELSLPMATTSLAGLMSASDKSKLNSALTSVSLATISDLNSSWDALLKAAPAAATASTMGFMSASDKAKMTEFSNALYNLETMGLLKNDGNGYLERLSSVTQSTNSITINFVAQHLTSAGVPQSGYSIVTLPAASTTKAGLMSATDFVLLQGLSHAASSGGGNGILHAPLTTSRTSTSVSINYTVSQYDGSAFKEVDFNLPIPSATTSLPGLMSASDKTTIGYLYGGGGGVSWSTISGWFVNNTSATVNAQKIMKVDSYFDLYAIRIEDTEHQVYHITEGTDAGPLIAVCGSYQTTRGDYIAMFTVVLPNTARRPYATRYVINY